MCVRVRVRERECAACVQLVLVCVCLYRPVLRTARAASSDAGRGCCATIASTMTAPTMVATVETNAVRTLVIRKDLKESTLFSPGEPRFEGNMCGGDV